MKFIFSILFLLLWVFASHSQSLLWKVSGKGLNKPSYIYGTIHIQDKRVFQFGDVVEEKFSECDAYAMEILMDGLTKETIENTMLMKDKTLKDLLSDEDYKYLDAYCKKNMGQGVFFLNKMKPFFVSSQLMQLNMEQDMPEALDMHFLTKAKEAGKLTFGVEKFEDQIAAIDQISLEEQAKMLMDGIRDTTQESNQFDELLETYLKGDIDKMPELSKDTSMPDNFNQVFLVSRNYTMAKNGLKLMKKQPTFMAVGAAHLGGEEGVLELIRKKGYTVEPVLFEFKKDQE